MGEGPLILSAAMLASAIGDRWSEEEIELAAELLARGGGRLPSGTRSLPQQFVREIQRERLLAAMLRATAELGFQTATVKDVLDRAGVSRPTFYEHFANKEDCFLVALDSGARRVCKRVEAASGEGDWRERLRDGLGEVLRFAAAEPDTARALVVESRVAGRAAVPQRRQLLDRFADWIDRDAPGEPPGEPPSLTAAAVAGGIEAVIHAHICRGETDLVPLLPSLMYFAVLPYAGPDAAIEELRLASPQ